MIDVLKAATASVSAEQRLNVAREYLQWLILQALDDAGYRENLIFVGGTCLRVVYGLRRFSEDLDFSLSTRRGYATADMSAAVLQRLHRLGLDAGCSAIKDHKTVASFFVRFSGLMAALGIASRTDQKLSIKVEVDKNPPGGATTEEFLFQDPVMFMVNHYDLPSLFATKLHAFFYRGYDKGRDYYDLLFLLGKKVVPNLRLFQSAVRQTHPSVTFPTLRDVYDAVRKKLAVMDDKRVLSDVGPFLLEPSQERFLTRAVLLKALDQAIA